MRAYGELIFCVVGVGLGAAVLRPIVHPLFERKPFVSMRNGSCAENLKALATSLNFYAADHEDRYPYRDNWMDGLTPYVPAKDRYQCPNIPSGYGYAFNGYLDRDQKSKVKRPESVPLVYDSVNPTRNASDLFASLPTQANRRNIACVDGHVALKVVKP